ncbi:MAG: phosphatase PAP2 family protein, partial [Bacteroidia bacterium]
DKKQPGAFVSLLRSLYPIFMLSYFYTETNYLRNIVFAGNFDAQVSSLEEQIFHCQPSLRFCMAVPQKWFNELMNICYFSYYLITAIACFGLYFYNRSDSYRGIFIVIFSFYMYYLIYDLFPVVGPQFYFSPEQAYLERPYLFGRIMGYLIATIEEPTGAFPSSHVGIALILSWVSYKYVRKLFWFIFPFAFGICFATVYLKAHYLLDVIGGLITVPLFIFISNSVYTWLTRKHQPEPAVHDN